MPRTFGELATALRDPAATRRRETLHEIETQLSEEEIERFADYAAQLGTTAAIELCPALAHTASPTLAELLARFATTGEALLRERALEALARISEPVRLPACLDLLAAPDPALRRTACRLVGASAGLTAALRVAALLEDAGGGVALEALSAIRRLRCAEATPSVERLLGHVEPEVRIAALETILDLGGEPPRVQTCALLTGDASTKVRTAAAWALGRRPNPACAEALRTALSAEPDVEVLGAIAAALALQPSDATVEALVAASGRERRSAVALACRRALATMDAEVVYRVCERRLAAAEPAVRWATAMVLGDLALPRTCCLMTARLAAEPAPEIRAALLEAIGRGGWTEHWDAVRAHLNGPPCEAYAAADALTEMVDEPHLESFLHILMETRRDMIREAVLLRLALIGRSRLPGSAWPVLRGFLWGDRRSSGILAAEAAGGTATPEPLPDLLQTVEEAKDPELRRAAGRASLRLLKGDLEALIGAAGGRWRALATLLADQTGLGPRGPEVCRLIARRLAEGETGAADALAVASRIDPAALAAAIREAKEADLEPLIRAWHALPAAARRGRPIDYSALLRAPGAAVRALALDCLEARDEALLPLLVDLAVVDPDAEVQTAARRALKRLVEEAA